MDRRSVFFLAGILVAGPVHADMIELKDEGILNGTVLSRNEQETKFKDGKGKVRVIANKNILFMEREDPRQKKAAEKRKWKEKADAFMQGVQKGPAGIKQASDSLTQKLVGEASKPLDRSAANAKSAQFAGAMDEYSKNVSGGATRDQKIRIEMEKNRIFEQRMMKGLSATEEDIEKDLREEGRFSKL